MSLIQTFFADDFEFRHACDMRPTLGLAYRSGVLGQYWKCMVCGKNSWEPVPDENENSN